MNRSAILSVPFLALIFAGCLGSTGPNESCEDFDLQEHTDYLEEHADEEEVAITESGLQYSVIQEGDGSSPTLDSTVEIEYEGRRIDGSTFVTTENGGPEETVVEGLLPGLEEGLQLMKEGATFEFVLPSHLGYGQTAGGEFCPGTTLVFEVTLVEIIE